jgi:hypothetical protein
MADELTSGVNAPETPTGQSQTSGEAPQIQPKQEAEKPAKVNLHELPEFKGYQEQFNRTVGALKYELEQLKAERAQAAMSGMDDLEKANFLLQQKEQEIANYRQAMQQAQIEQQRQRDLQALAEDSGAPMNVLGVAETYDEAVKLALKWMKDNGATKKEIEEAKKEANSVDLGGGAANTPADRETRERHELLKKGDTRSLFLKMLEG